VNCFGFINAGAFFNAALAPLIKHWRLKGFRVTFFGDDILGLTPVVDVHFNSQGKFTVYIETLDDCR
jgi:hypothetical protein